VHIYILHPKLLQWNFSNLSAIYTKWCAQTFPPIFGLFKLFDRNFAKLVAPPSEKNENYVVHLKIPSEKRLKTASKLAYVLLDWPAI